MAFCLLSLSVASERLNFSPKKLKISTFPVSSLFSEKAKINL